MGVRPAGVRAVARGCGGDRDGRRLDCGGIHGFGGADHRLADGIVQQSAMERNEKVKGTFAGAIWGAKGGDDGEGYREVEKWAKA